MTESQIQDEFKRLAATNIIVSAWLKYAEHFGIPESVMLKGIIVHLADANVKMMESAVLQLQELPSIFRAPVHQQPTMG